MSALLAKEWRENRLLLLSFLVLAPALALACRVWLSGWEPEKVEASSPWVVFTLSLLYVLGVGADLFAGDVGSGRIGFLAALPVRAATVWAAKVLFLFGTAAVYAALVTAMEAAAFGVAPGRAHATRLLVAAGAGCAAAFFSAAIDRGFAVVVATLLAMAVGAWVHHLLEVNDVGGAGLPVLVAIAAAFLAGSFAAFTGGRPHLGSRIRRVALAATGFLLFLLPAAAFTGVAAASWLSIDPADDDLRYAVQMPHRGGDWAIVWAKPRGSPPPGLRRPWALWAVNVRDGRLRRIDAGVDDPRRDYPSVLPDGPGRITLLDILTRSEIDLEAGRTVASRWVPPEVAEELEDRAWLLRNGFPRREDDDGPRGWSRIPTGPDSCFVRRGSERALYLRASRKLVPLDVPERGWGMYGALVPEGGAGSAFLLTQRGPVCALHLVPLDGRPRVELLRGQYQGSAFSPDRRRAVLCAAGEAWLLDGDRAALTRLPVEVGRCYRARTLWDWDSSRFLIGTRSDAWLVTVADGEPAATPLDLPWRRGEIHHDLAGDRFLVTRTVRGGDVLESVTLDGEVTRLLPREEE